MSDGKLLDKAVTIRLPHEVYAAVKKKAEDKRDDFPRYNEADVVRIAIVTYLKEKGYLDKEKNYL